MSERLSSYLILLGGTLVIAALWAVSVLFVRWDTARRRLTEMERKAWIAVTILLPLFGFALYLVLRVFRRYLTPQGGVEEERFYNEGRVTDARARASRWEEDLPAAGRRSMARRPAGSRTRAASERRPPEVGVPPAWDVPGGRNGGSGVERHTLGTLPTIAPLPPAGWSLVVLQGPHLGQHFVLNRFPILIGRGPDASIPLDADLNVSRRHAEIYSEGSMLRIRDMGSSHGTLVNDTPAADHALLPGDRVTVGSTEMILRGAP